MDDVERTLGLTGDTDGSAGSFSLQLQERPDWPQLATTDHYVERTLGLTGDTDGSAGSFSLQLQETRLTTTDH